MQPAAGRRAKILLALLAIPVIVILGVLAFTSYQASKTIHELLGENKTLQRSIANLTEETEIGYAKVLEQGERDGKLYTKLLFVETDRADKSLRVLEKEFEIEGDIVHFDALIVKFAREDIVSGRERALYLWRRIYGESMPPEEGFPIESEGREPARYSDLCAKLPIRDREMFWTEIWDLANDPRSLREAGISAIYGKAVYKGLRPGLIYIFKIDASGNLYPETVPAL